MTWIELQGHLDQVRASLVALEKEIVAADPPPELLDKFHATLDAVRNSVWAVLDHDAVEAKHSVANLRLERTVAMCRRTVQDLDEGVLDRSSAAFSVGSSSRTSPFFDLRFTSPTAAVRSVSTMMLPSAVTRISALEIPPVLAGITTPASAMTVV